MPQDIIDKVNALEKTNGISNQLTFTDHEGNPVGTVKLTHENEDDVDIPGVPKANISPRQPHDDQMDQTIKVNLTDLGDTRVPAIEQETAEPVI